MANDALEDLGNLCVSLGVHPMNLGTGALLPDLVDHLAAVTV